MKIDSDLITNPPEQNITIMKYFKTFPVYLRSHRMQYHRKIRHVQPGLEITYTHEGRAAFVVGSQVYMQQAGSLMIVPGHLPHQVFFDPMTNFKRTVICIDISRIQKEDSLDLQPLLTEEGFTPVRPSHFKLSPQFCTEFKQITQKMQYELHWQLTGWKRMLFSHLIGLSVLLQRLNNQYNPIDFGTVGEKQVSEVVQQCCQYIEQGLKEDLSLERVSGILSVSPEHLTRLFRKEKGVPYYSLKYSHQYN